MDGLVSVIIPTQKGADGLIKTIDSVKKQSYKSIEIIIVDDNGLGSEEQIRTAQALADLIDANEVKYLPLREHKNGSFARNAGFRISDGEVIAFLDDDDFFLPTKIEDELDYMVQTGADMVACGGYYIDQNRVGYIERPTKRRNVLYDYLTGKYLFNTSTLLIKKNVVEDLEGFDDRFFRHQDWEFVTRVMCSYKVELLDKPLIIKRKVGRNKVVDPERAADLREFFIDERKKDIEGAIGNRLTKKVIEYHYRDLAIGYFMALRWKKGLNMLKKTGNASMSFIKCFPQIGYLIIRKQLRGKRKISSKELHNMI